MPIGDSTMKINELCETTAGAVASVAMGIGPVIKRQPKNTDGTAKNALDMTAKKKKPKTKKA